MLDAFIFKNVRRLLTKKEHSNDKNEDAITSMVFTPLRFMTAQNALTCVRSFLPLEIDRSRIPIAHSVQLWPQLRASSWQGASVTRCEPDVVLNFQFDTGSPLTLIGEMKWGAVDDAVLAHEMKRQHEGVRRLDRKSADMVKFAIVKYPAKHTAKQLGCQSLLTWKQVHRLLNRLSQSHPTEAAVADWSSLIADFLALAEQLVFEGFVFDDQDLIPDIHQEIVFFAR